MSIAFIGTVSQDKIDYALSLGVDKVVMFVPTEHEDDTRPVYESLYPKYKDKITLYTGDVFSSIASVIDKYEEESITFVV